MMKTEIAVTKRRVANPLYCLIFSLFFFGGGGGGGTKTKTTCFEIVTIST